MGEIFILLTAALFFCASLVVSGPAHAKGGSSTRTVSNMEPEPDYEAELRERLLKRNEDWALEGDRMFESFKDLFDGKATPGTITGTMLDGINQQKAYLPQLQRTIDEMYGVNSGIDSVIDRFGNLAGEYDAANQQFGREFDEVTGLYRNLVGDFTNLHDTSQADYNETRQLFRDLGLEYDAANAKFGGQYDDIYGRADEMNRDATAGNLPTQFEENFRKGIFNSTRYALGDALSDLASRGVMDSSVANRSIDQISQDAQDKAAQNWLNSYNTYYGVRGNSIASMLAATDSASASHFKGLEGKGQTYRDMNDTTDKRTNMGIQALLGRGQVLGGMSDNVGKKASSHFTGLAGKGDSYKGQLTGYQSQAQNLHNIFQNQNQQLDNFMKPAESWLNSLGGIYGLGQGLYAPQVDMYKLLRDTRYRPTQDTIVEKGGK